MNMSESAADRSEKDSPPTKCGKLTDAGDAPAKAAGESQDLDEGAAAARSCSSGDILKGFLIDRVLNESVHRKSMTVVGHYADKADQVGILTMEKSPFSLDMFKDMCGAEATDLTPLLQNGIYNTFRVTAGPEYNATPGHIDKHSLHTYRIMEESAEDYAEITLPWIEESSFNIQWVYNILDKTRESESIVVEDPDEKTGFVMVPDYKWDRKQVNDLYCLAIVHMRGIKSLRDLCQEHLPLLKNIRDKGTAGIMTTYGVDANELRVYFHYQPSYYHLHVHFTHIKYEAPGTHVLKAHLLADVIENIQICPDFYQRKGLSFLLQEGTTLFGKYRQAGRLKCSSQADRPSDTNL